MTMVLAPWRCLLGDNEWCTADSPCFTCADEAHRARVAAGNCPPDCLECKTATLVVGVQVGAETRTRKNKPVGWNENANAWERGIPTDSHGMPFLDKTGTVMGAKQVAENRHTIDNTMRHWNAVNAAQTTGSN